jgi:hypothetical protein
MIYPQYTLPEIHFIKHCLTHTTINGSEAAALAVLLHKVDEHLKILQIENQGEVIQNEELQNS